ncbi:TPA: TcdA/TcdB pore-forming domain-containing protein [Providencia alcalifaciens]|uniref:TcdA/TcdB pore-forming domain-containing protein n=1 Tax=Providencia alcalifaciens TaxID=126385 RepID=UPI0012B525C2|nr:TcdA/TcdB pore-forming domain-containing protein [Providencia alcalifaciens]MTC37500.1 prevent-host-death family protein [Providencia alcalifaciens]
MGKDSHESLFTAAKQVYTHIKKDADLMNKVSDIKSGYKRHGEWNESLTNQKVALEEKITDIIYMNYSRTTPAGIDGLNIIEQKKFLADFKQYRSENKNIEVKVQGKNDNKFSSLTDDELLDGSAYRILPKNYRERYNSRSMLMSRLTVNVKKEYFADLAKALMQLYENDPNKKVMQAKIMGPKKLGRMTDQAVIYFSEASLQSATEISQQLKALLPADAMIEHVPMGMYRVDKGFSYSETLEGQSSSHGESRAEMIAKGIVSSLISDKPLELSLTKVLRVHGYDAEQPALLSQSVKETYFDISITGSGTNSGNHFSPDIEKFKQDPIEFARNYNINTKVLNSILQIPAEGKILFNKNFGKGYQVEYVDSTDEQHQRYIIDCYLLDSKARNKESKYVEYVDIPKDHPEKDFLFTGLLRGESIVVIVLDSEHYRIYRDNRADASLLYDDVVMAVDARDYILPEKNISKANAFMHFNGNEWKLIVQPQRNRISLSAEDNIVKVQKAGDYNLSDRTQRFENARDSVHRELKMLAKKVNVKIGDIPSETVFLAESQYSETQPSELLESHSSLKTWLDIGSQLQQKLDIQIQELKKNRQILEESLIGVTDITRKKKIENAIEMNKTIISMQNRQYGELFYHLREVEYSWLWQRIKANQGMSAVVKIKEFDPNMGINSPYAYHLTINERYENLIYLHKLTRNIRFKNEFSEGIKQYKEISILDVNDTVPSQLLKKMYVTNEYTARERGALYRVIQETTYEEYISHVLTQTGKISEFFSEAGSKTNRLIPQDFYLSLVRSESGGRCYPLVRGMSVGLAREGHLGADKLIDKLYIAAAAPDSRDSLLLQDSLKRLHSNVEAVEASFSHGIMDLKKIQSLLGLKSETMMFAINSKSHSMLVGKTVSGEQSTYYFYDPNFGLFSFKNSKRLFSSLNKFFTEKKMADYYSAYEVENKPAFELVFINTDEMAKVPIGNYLSVNDLSIDEKLSDLSERGKKVEQLIFKQKEIIEDTRLKASLTILDAQQWGERVNDATLKLSAEKHFNGKWIPLFSSAEQASDNLYRIKFIHIENPDLTRWVETTDKTFIEFHQYSIEQMELFNRYYRFEENKIKAQLNEADAASVDGLNVGIAIQSIIQWVENKNRNEASEKKNSPNLLLALKIHTYMNYSMMAYGIANDMAKINQIIKIGLKTGREITATEMNSFFSSMAKTANEGLAVIFSGALVGFDIYELSNAESDSERIIFGTQLAFDSMSFAAVSGGIGLGAAGYAGAATALGGASVLVAGLGIGFIGLARNFAIIGEDAKAVGRYFYALDEAYKGNGFNYIPDQKILIPKFGAIFSTLDLKHNQIQFDSQYIYRTSERSSGGGRRNYIFWAGNNPTMVKNRAQAINIRQGIGYPLAIHKLDFFDTDTLMLPVIPKSYIKYSYNLWPGCTLRHDSGFDVIRRLEQEDNFDYDFYIFPSENTITQIFHEYVDTPIEIILDEKNRALIVPQLAREWHGKIEYKIKGNGGTYKLSLNSGIRIKLTDDTKNNQNSKWIIDASQLENSTVKIQNNQFTVGDIQIDVDVDSVQGQIIVVNKHKEVQRIDLSSAQSTILSEDEKLWQGDAKDLAQHLNHYAEQHKKHGQFIVITNHQYNGKDVGRAFYDVSNQRYIFIDTLDANKQYAILSSVVGDVAYFYLPTQKQIWAVDIATGTISSEYQFENPNNRPFEILQLWKGYGHIYFSCRYTDTNEVVNFQIEQNIIKLISLDADSTLLERLAQTPTQFSAISPQAFLRNYMLSSTYKTNGEQPVQIEADLGSVVAISGVDSNQALHRYWLRVADSLLIKPNLSPSLGYGETPTNIRLHQSHWAIPPDLALMGSLFDEKGTEIFYFYSHKNKELYRQEGPGQDILNVTKPTAWFLNTPYGMQNAAFWQGNLFISNIDGVICQIDDKGNYHPSALTENWFKERANWWRELGDYYCCKTITLVGLNKGSAEKIIPAWSLNGKVIIAHELSLENNIQFLGLDADNSGALIFDPTTQKLYRQQFATENQLSSAFGQGRELLDESALPNVVDVYPDLQFSNVKMVGDGVLMFAKSGEILFVDLLQNKDNTTSSHLGSSLIIRGSDQNDKLSPVVIQSVKNIVLSAGNGQDTYTISKAVWGHYHSIIIDNNALDSLMDTLILPVSENDELVVSQHNDDLFITDMKQNTTLVFRKVFGDQKQAHQHLQLRFVDQTQDVSLEQFIQNHSLNLAIDLAETHIELNNYQHIEHDVHSSLLSEHVAGFAKKDGLVMPGMDSPFLPNVNTHNVLLSHLS